VLTSTTSFEPTRLAHSRADESRESTRRVRVFDSNTAVTYTAAGSTSAWRAYSHDQDSAKPQARLLDAIS